MKKHVRLWLIVFAIGAIASAFIVSRLDRMITVSEVQVTKDYTIEETLYKDSIVCTEDGTLLKSALNSAMNENYIFLSYAEKENDKKNSYIFIGSKYLEIKSYAQRGSLYYLLLTNEKDRVMPSTDYEVEYTFVKISGETGEMQVIGKIYTTGIPWIIDTGTDTLLLSYWVQESARIEKYSIKSNKMTGEPISIGSCYEKAVSLNEQQFVCGYNQLIGPKKTYEKYKSYLGWVDIEGNVLTSYNLGKYFVEKVIIDKSKIYVLLTHRNTTKSKLLTADLDFENEKFENIRIYRLPELLDAKFTTYDEMTFDAEKQRLNFMVRGPFAWDWSSSFLGAAYIDLKDGEVVPRVQAEIIINPKQSFYPEYVYIGDQTIFCFTTSKGQALYMKASS